MAIWKTGGSLEHPGFPHTEVELAKVAKGLEMVWILLKNPVLVPVLATPILF